MGAACCGGTSSAYVEKPFSGIQSNGQYVVDGVVIPRREMSEQEKARRGITDNDWRGSMFGRTSCTGGPGGVRFGDAYRLTHNKKSDPVPDPAQDIEQHPVQQPYRRPEQYPIQQPNRR